MSPSEEGRLCVRDVQIWLSDLVKNVETEAECFRSTDDLFDYVAGDDFVKYCGQEGSNALMLWLRKSFFHGSVDHKLLAYHRIKLRHFDEYVNSVCEGQNSAAKTTNTGTKARQNVDTTLNTLDFRAEQVDRHRKSAIEKKKQATPLYSNSEASRDIMDYAELNAHRECMGFSEGEDKYWLFKKDTTTMWVLRKQHTEIRSPGTEI